MEFSEVIGKRRSTRKFADSSVSRDEIVKMLDAAIAAPNACNMQSWHFYVVTDGDIKRRMADEGVMAAWAATAPVIFVICTDAKNITERFGEIGEKLFAVQDTALAAENLLLCAADFGLGGCFMGAFDHEKCRTLLGIADGHNPVAMIPVGKPANELPVRPRNPFESAVTFVGDENSAEKAEVNTQFRGYEVRNSNLPGAVFDNLNLKKSTFHNINMPDSSFDDINLSGTRFSDINMKDCEYGDLTMEGSKFGCVDMKNCIFDNPMFDGTTFRNCSFKGVKLENCDTEGMTVDGKELK